VQLDREDEMRLLMVALVVALSGCGSWQKPGATPEQAAQDQAECKYEATKAHGYTSTAAVFANDCMEMRGYRATLN
jgi:uncharacterized protein YceK